MTALELISLANQVLFVGLFVAVLWHAMRQPTRASVNTLLLFGSIAVVVVLARLATAFSLNETGWYSSTILVALSVAPLAMVRLVDDFSGTPRWVQVVGLVAFGVVAALSIFAFAAVEQIVELAVIAWFLLVGGYAAYAFAREATRTHGITRRRMTAVALGALLFIAAVIIAFVNVLLPTPMLGMIGPLLALGAVIAFFLGFAPPSWIRRAWREPDLRHFLERSIHLSALEDERRALVEVQEAAAAAFGATGARIGIAGTQLGTLRYPSAMGGWVEYRDDEFIAGQAYSRQERIVSLDASRADPEHASVYQSAAANTVIAAPITAEERRIGVLVIFAERAPIFIEDDLWLIELLAGQIAVLLDARTLATLAADIRSREEAARLKEEFLSAAAHDLRTPLTVVLGQAELLERRMARDPNAPVDAAGVTRIAREARRLRDLVSELLDAQRLEQGSAIMDPADSDLGEVIRAVHERFRDHGLDLRMTMPEQPITSRVDRMRLEQVLDNLVENALKYTANGELPELVLEAGGATEARLRVIDHGVGIPEDEHERIFERFYRASNVQSITDTGMGLGLYICRRTVEAHGGRIWVEPTPGGGSTFVVSLPALAAAQPETTTVVPPAVQVPTREAAADA